MSENGGHLTVPVMVNGTPLNFVVDTGGVFTAISARAAKTLNMRSTGFLFVTDVSGARTVPVVVADMFQMGHEQAKNFSLMVATLEPGEDGILAPDLLRNFDVELDFASMTMKLFRHRHCPDHTVYWTDAFIVVPFHTSNMTHMRAAVKLDGKDTDAILDTGAPMSVLSLNEANVLFDLDAASPGVQYLSKVGGIAGTQVDAYSYAFKSLSLDRVVVSNPHILLTKGRNFLNADGAALLLGMDVLRYLHLYISYGDNTLYVSDAEAR